jgi:cbb3-type cytochrome oxidase subunit 3
VVGAGGTLALSIFVAVVIGGSFLLLGVLCWIFWRAAKRDRDLPPPS